MKITNVPSLPGQSITLTDKQWKDFVKKSTFVVHTPPPPPPAPSKMIFLKLAVMMNMFVLSGFMLEGFHRELTFIPYLAVVWMGVAWVYLVLAWVRNW